jgi:hypothetical protein
LAIQRNRYRRRNVQETSCPEAQQA